MFNHAAVLGGDNGGLEHEQLRKTEYNIDGGIRKDARVVDVGNLPERDWPEPYGRPESVHCRIAFEKIRKRRFEAITRREVNAIFEYVDVDKDEYISVFEIKALINLIINDIDSDLGHDLEVIFKQCDSSGDGVVDMDELAQAFKLSIDHSATKRILRGAEDRLHAWAKRKHVVRYLEDSDTTAESCQSLPFYVIFFVISFMLVVNHTQITDGYWERQLGMKAWNLPASGELYAPDTMVFAYPKTGETTPLDYARNVLLAKRMGLDDNWAMRGRVNNYQQVIGGLMITVSAGQFTRCRDADLEAMYMPAEVKGLPANDTRLANTYPPPALSELCIDRENPTEKSEFIPVHVDVTWDRVDTMLQNMISGLWAPETSFEMKFAAVTFNADTGMLQQNEITYTLAEDGQIQGETAFVNFNTRPYDMKSMWSGSTLFVLDAVWGGLVFYLFGREIMQIGTLWWRVGRKRLCGMYLDFWNIVDWFNIIQSVLLGYYWYSITRAAKDLEAELIAMPLDQGLSNPGAVKAATASLLEGTADIGSSHQVFQVLIAAFSASTMLAFFKAFRANPRLNVVAQTISDASVDLVHFLIVLLTIFFVFVMVGHFSFGESVEFFSTVSDTVFTCFMCMMLFLYDDIRVPCTAEAGFAFSTIYFVLYFLFMSVLLFNMILAIIFDVYSDVKADAGDAEFLWDQVTNMMDARAERLAEIRKLVVREEEKAKLTGVPADVDSRLLNRTAVLQGLVERGVHDEDIITPDTLREAFGNRFGRAQACFLLRDVEYFVKNERYMPHVGTGDVMRMMGRLDMNVRELLARARYEHSDPVSYQKSLSDLEDMMGEIEDSVMSVNQAVAGKKTAGETAAAAEETGDKKSNAGSNQEANMAVGSDNEFPQFTFKAGQGGTYPKFNFNDL